MVEIKESGSSKSRKKNKFLNKRLLAGILLIIPFINGFLTPVPKGTSYEGFPCKVSDIKFLYDLSYIKNGKRVHEHRIFNEQLKLIRQADQFIIADMFLFNDDYDRKNTFPNLSGKLTRALIEQKKKHPALKIVFITDEINNFYGAYESKYIKTLRDHHIDVIITDSNKMRNSNPLYSSLWKTFIQWFGTAGKGWIKNPFGSDSPKVTLRAYLKLLNFKANHRKVLITNHAAIIASANPHDASGYHSNIAFRVEGEIVNDLIVSERAVAEFSGGSIPDVYYVSKKETDNHTRVMLITEGKIRKHVLSEIRNTQSNDKITIGMFYLSERTLIKELIKASYRGVDIRLILDPNKDAFGIEKNGIPNRQTAMELVKKSNGKIKIRWYDTHGEQYHSKMMAIEKNDTVTIIGGSANFTRRNIGDYNLETDLKITTTKKHPFAQQVLKYFDRIWENQDGNYTIDFNKYREDKFLKNMIYRFQEWSGLCTF